MHDQVLEEKENEGGAPSTSEVAKAGDAGAADDETTRKRAADAPPDDAPSGKATRVDGVRKGPLAGWAQRLARGISRLRPKEPAASGSA